MISNLKKIAKLLRYYILLSSTSAGSGHPTSSLSAVELMAALMFGGFFHYDLKRPNLANNDRLIFSKGHASPLYYALWAAAGSLNEKDLKNYRKFSSVLEGHPTKRFKYTETATGSLGQGLSVGVGMALNGKYLDHLPYKTYVLLGDSEMAEGSNWEAMELAAHYKLSNLIAIVDVNRLGQRGETMAGYKVKDYFDKAKSFGWQAAVINGHNFKEIISAFKKAQKADQPFMIIARTVKGKGISFLEGKGGWHGRVLNKDEFGRAVLELGKIDKVKVSLTKPKNLKAKKQILRTKLGSLKSAGGPLATRKAYGQALLKLYPKHKNLVVLDAEVSNSTYSELFKEAYPSRFFEMFVAEQNMVGLATGLSARGQLPFVSTFAAFFTRAFDQIRMAQYSESNIKFVGSHGGVSIGADGSSQMGLEDLAMFRSILNSVVLYPADRVSAEKLTLAMAKHQGLAYLRTTRSATPVLYSDKENFKIGGSKILRSSSKDQITVVAAGITVFEALKAYDQLLNEKIKIRIIDLYSIKPLDIKTLTKAARETKGLITVEDHYPAGGLGEAVAAALSGLVKVEIMAVSKIPRSGRPDQLLNYEQINDQAIIKKVKEIIYGQKKK